MLHIYTIDQAPGVIWLHLVATLCAVVLGLLALVRRKGTVAHKWLGRMWVLSMFVAALSSFWIQARGRLGWIHILSVVVLFSMSYAIYAIRCGNVRGHKNSMMFTFAGLLVAGIFTLLPYRMLGQWIFG
jgi:uncharacterized membrane protein